MTATFVARFFCASEAGATDNSMKRAKTETIERAECIKISRSFRLINVIGNAFSEAACYYERLQVSSEEISARIIDTI